jgi:tetratricopeptide (TPR) repeat protein
MRFARIYLFVALLLIGNTVHARKSYDERGNPLAESAAQSKPIGAQGVTGQTSIPENAAGTSKSSPSEVAYPQKEAQNKEAENQADEDAEKQVQNPLTKVYLENAQLYLRSGRVDKALEFLRRSFEAGEDSYAREARLQSYYLRARRGDTGLASEIEGVDETLRLTASLRVADGYYACAREQKQKPECLSEAERLYAYLAELTPSSAEGRLAAFRLGQLMLEEGRFEAALPHLIRLLANEPKTPARAKELPFDRAWFMLASLYEHPGYHRDTHKARFAYQQVLKYPGSPYHKQAKERILWLERFGTGAP